MRKYNFSVKAALAVFAVALSACSSDNDIVENNPTNPETPVSDTEMSFSAVMDGVTTRTVFNSNSTIWAAGDAIKIVNRATITAPDQTGYSWAGTFNLKTHGGGYTKEETFTGTRIQSNGDGTDSFYAFYPSDCKVGYDEGKDVAQIKGEVTSVQTAMDGTYDQSLHFMTAHSNNSTFSFKNVCALLKITLTNSNISRVKVVANPKYDQIYDQSFKYTYITGKFIATVRNTDKPDDPKAVEGTTYGIQANGTAAEVQKTYVELRADGEGGSVDTPIGDGTYYMVVLPATLTNGFTLLLETADGNTIYQRVNSNTTAFERNKMYDLGTYNCSSLPADMTALTDVVDLDLPSGTLWATKNIDKTGAFVASEDVYGDYFSWGKKNVPGTYSDPDYTEQTLKAAADVAYSYNNKYCMPIYAQVYEFWNGTYKSKTSSTASAPYGARFTVATGRSIFIPYGGHYYRITMGVGVQRLQGENEHAAYWSRTCNGNSGSYADAYTLHFETKNGTLTQLNPTGGDNWGDDRQTGRNIRPVATNIKIAPIYE